MDEKQLEAEQRMKGVTAFSWDSPEHCITGSLAAYKNEWGDLVVRQRSAGEEDIAIVVDERDVPGFLRFLADMRDDA